MSRILAISEDLKNAETQAAELNAAIKVLINQLSVSQEEKQEIFGKLQVSQRNSELWRKIADRSVAALIAIQQNADPNRVQEINSQALNEVSPWFYEALFSK